MGDIVKRLESCKARMEKHVYQSDITTELTMQDAAAEIKRLRSLVVTFCGPWAERYARDHGLPNGHLHPTHYDILANAEARMESFTRVELAEKPAETTP